MVTVDANRVASSFWAPAPGVPLDPGSAGPETGDLLANPGEQSAVSCSGPALAPSANPSGAPESPGLDLIRVSSLADETKARYSLAWRQWVAFFQERGVSPPGVTVPEALAWVRSRKWPPGSMHRHRYAVNHVYLANGFTVSLAAAPCPQGDLPREGLRRLGRRVWRCRLAGISADSGFGPGPGYQAAICCSMARVGFLFR